jgi:hypothetical protein
MYIYITASNISRFLSQIFKIRRKSCLVLVQGKRERGNRERERERETDREREKREKRKREREAREKREKERESTLRKKKPALHECLEVRERNFLADIQLGDFESKLVKFHILPLQYVVV